MRLTAQLGAVMVGVTPAIPPRETKTAAQRRWGTAAITAMRDAGCGRGAGADYFCRTAGRNGAPADGRGYAARYQHHQNTRSAKLGRVQDVAVRKQVTLADLGEGWQQRGGKGGVGGHTIGAVNIIRDDSLRTNAIGERR